MTVHRHTHTHKKPGTWWGVGWVVVLGRVFQDALPHDLRVEKLGVSQPLSPFCAKSHQLRLPLCNPMDCS